MILRTVLILCTVIVSLCISTAAGAGQTATGRDKLFQEMARKLISGIEGSGEEQKNCPKLNTTPSFIDKLCWKRKRLRIALLPFNEGKTPVSIKIADEFNAELLRQLIDQAQDRYEFVARAELPTLIEEHDSWSGVIDKPVFRLLKSVANLDVLVVGSLLLEKSNALLSYKAVSMGGNILALTPEKTIHLSPQEAKATKPTITLDQAITQAAKDLADKAPDMAALVLDRIVYQNSGSQPEFGRYLKDRLSVALQNTFTNVVTGRKLKIRQFGDTLPEGTDVAYVLRGKYWVLSGSVEIRISLRNQKGEVVSWVGWIRTSTIEETNQDLLPKGEFGPLRNNDGLGPFNFHLTSDRGASPVYQIGDKLSLKISLGNDAWVYCFNLATDGRLYWLFPNPYHKEARLKGGSPLTIPGDLFPYELTMAGPPGNELLKCFAVSRDIAADLPPVLRGFDIETPLPKAMVRTLAPIFQQLPDVFMSEASIVVTLHK